MKLFLFFMLIFLVSCGSMKVISNDKTEIKDGIFYELKQKEPYSGVIAYYYDKQKKKIAEKRYYEDGVLYKVEEWTLKGVKKADSPIWTYQYGAYKISDDEDKKVFLSVGKDKEKSKAIEKAKKSMIFLLKYYKKIFREVASEYVDMGDLKKDVLEQSCKLIKNKILSDNFENLMSKSLVSRDKMLKDIINVQMSLHYDNLINSISKLELKETFKELSEEILEKSYEKFKKTWFSYLKDIKNLRTKNQEEIIKMMKDQNITRYELTFFDTGEKKTLKYSVKEHLIFTKWYKNENKKSKKSYNMKNNLDGKYFTWYENGNLEESSEYKNANLVNKFIKYYENGKKKEEGNYSEGKIIGEYITYYEDEAIKEKKTYDNGNLSSINSFYQSGNKKTEATYYNNKIEGFKFVYYDAENSPIKEESFYSNGVLEGDYKSYYENGKKKEIGQYSLGKKNKKFVGYHNNKKKSYTVSFKDGLMDGYYNAWHPNGKRSEKGRYKLGKKVSYFTLWYENGRKKEYTKYNKEGQKDGNSITWSKDGKKTITKYSNGEKI